MSEWVRVLAYVFLTLFLGTLLKELGFKGSRLIFILGAISLVGAAVICFGKIISLLPGVGEEGRRYVVAMLKIIGVGYAFGICSDICSELGETSLGNAVCLFGRIEIITLSVPFIKMIVEKGIEMI